MKMPAASVDPTIRGDTLSRPHASARIAHSSELLTFRLQVPAMTNFDHLSSRLTSKRLTISAARSASRVAGLLTFLSQVPDLTLFNLLYPRPAVRSRPPHSTSSHQKSPVIPPIPLNSTCAVPPKRNISSRSVTRSIRSQPATILRSSTFPATVVPGQFLPERTWETILSAAEKGACGLFKSHRGRGGCIAGIASAITRWWLNFAGKGTRC